jgi:hypothetical protein
MMGYIPSQSDVTLEKSNGELEKNFVAWAVTFTTERADVSVTHTTRDDFETNLPGFGGVDDDILDNWRMSKWIIWERKGANDTYPKAAQDPKLQPPYKRSRGSASTTVTKTKKELKKFHKSEDDYLHMIFIEKNFVVFDSNNSSIKIFFNNFSRKPCSYSQTKMI